MELAVSAVWSDIKGKIGWLFAALLLFLPAPVCSALRINEVVQCNVGKLTDELNEFPDGWVELYNDGPAAVSLHQYAVVRKNRFAKAYRLPGIELPPYAYVLLYCDKEGKGLHTDFRLPIDTVSSLFLFRTDGTVADSVELPPMLAANVPYCRQSAGVWRFCETATPGLPNASDSVSAQAPAPSFSESGGVKDGAFCLQLALPLNAPSGSCIRYTTDGSEPDGESARYVHPLAISQSVAVRAKTFATGYADSPTQTHSYLFLNRQQTLPVVSLVADSAFFYDDELGILVKGIYGKTHPNSVPVVDVFGRANYYYGWHRPVNIEYFPVGAETEAINQPAQTKVGGKAGRRQAEKSLVLKADKRFGTNSFLYPFFEDKPWLTSNKSVVLRNSGQDAPYTYFRDAFAHKAFARHTSVDYLSYQPVILYLNGNYMGIRTLRERSNDDYLRANYRDLHGFDLIEGVGGLVKSGDSAAFCQFREVYSNSASSYQQLDSLMDVDEFADYLILYALFCNTDFPGNNMLMWKTPATKWRWIVKDFDSAMGVSRSPATFQYLNYILREPPFTDRGVFNSEQSCLLFRKMMSFPQFRQMFIDRAAVYMGTFASVESLTRLVDSLATNIEYEMPFFMEMRQKDELKWTCSVVALKKWLADRIPFFYADLSRFFHMGDPVPLKVIAGEKGCLNNIALADGCFDGMFFSGRRMRVSADSSVAFQSDGYQSEGTLSVPVARCSHRIGECWRTSDFDLPDDAGAVWAVQYVKGDSLYTELFDCETLDWKIPSGAATVRIEKGGMNVQQAIDDSNLRFVACDFSGRVVARGRYSDVMPVLQFGKTYILTTLAGDVVLRKWKVRRMD